MAPDNVKDNIVITHIVLMVMTFPVGGLNVNFDIPGPGCIANTYAGIKKIGTGVAVMNSRN
jgi:hypothetical protein